jgi:hypothetical protein
VKGDITRSTFDASKAYRAVRQQQGRVALDADWNEQVDILDHLSRATLVDLLGSAAAPASGGMGIAVNDGVLSLEGERIYVDGMLCESEDPVTVHDPDVQTAEANGVYIAYLDVWLRTITAVEDPDIREIALGGPDTCTRDQVTWTVRLAPLEGSEATCAGSAETWDALIAPRTTALTARATPSTSETDPCIVAPGSGYRGLENQLYRVEIHAGGTDTAATFKWARENASVLGEWLPGTRSDELQVRFIGRSADQAVTSGQWVEVTDDSRELAGQPGDLYRVTTVEGDAIGIDGTADRTAFPSRPKVRVWSSAGAVPASQTDTDDGFIRLEDGVEVKFGAGSYASGDYWLVPARTASADLLWPVSATGTPLAQPAFGPAHHYAKLAIVELGESGWSFLEDCRELFGPLVDALSAAIEEPFQITGLSLRKPGSFGTLLYRDLMTGTLPATVNWNAFTFSSDASGGGAGGGKIDPKAGGKEIGTTKPAYFTIRADVETSLAGINWDLATLWVFLDVADVLPYQSKPTDIFIKRFVPERLDGTVTTTSPESENGMQVVSIEWTPTDETIDHLAELVASTVPNIFYPIRCELGVTQIDRGILREAGRLSFYFTLVDGGAVPIGDGPIKDVPKGDTGPIMKPTKKT